MDTTPGSFANSMFGGGVTSPGDYYKQNPYAQQVMGMGMAQVDPTQQAQFRNAQMQQLGQLQRIAGGQQQGAGELAVQRQVQNALAAQQAQARMARGGQNAALAMRQGARNAAGIGLSGAGQAQQAAMGDQMNAQGLLANVAGQGRQQDLGLAGQNAQLQQGYQQLLGNMGQGELSSMASMYGAAQQNPGMLGGLMQGAGGLLGGISDLVSDERLKTDVSDAGNDIDEMLGKLLPKAYVYKDKRHGAGKRVGIMAQDMERSKAGRTVVKERPVGKVLDVAAAISAALASAARLHHRLSKVERAGR